MKHLYFVTSALTIILAALNISSASDHSDNFNPEKANSSYLSIPFPVYADMRKSQMQQRINQVPKEKSIWDNPFAEYRNFALTSNSGGGGAPPKLDPLIFELPSHSLPRIDLLFQDDFYNKRRMVLKRFKLLLEKNDVASLGGLKVITNQDKVKENPLWPPLPHELKNEILSFLQPSDLCSLMLVSHACHASVLFLDMSPFLTSNIHSKVFVVNQDKVNENPLWPDLPYELNNIILESLKIADLCALRQACHSGYDIVSNRISPFLTTHGLKRIIKAHVANKSRKNAALNQPDEREYINALMRTSLRHNPTPVKALYCLYDIMECSPVKFKKYYMNYTTEQYFSRLFETLYLKQFETLYLKQFEVSYIKQFKSFDIKQLKISNYFDKSPSLLKLLFKHSIFNLDYNPTVEEGYEQIVPLENLFAKPPRSPGIILL